MQNNLNSTCTLTTLTNNEIDLVYGGGRKSKAQLQAESNIPRAAKIAFGVSQITGQLAQAFQAQASQTKHQKTQDAINIVAQGLQMVAAAAAITGVITTAKQGGK